MGKFLGPLAAIILVMYFAMNQDAVRSVVGAVTAPVEQGAKDAKTSESGAPKAPSWVISQERARRILRGKEGAKASGSGKSGAVRDVTDPGYKDIDAGGKEEDLPKLPKGKENASKKKAKRQGEGVKPYGAQAVAVQRAKGL